MVADLIPEERRADAYALTRLSKNVGIALGPAVGGLVATTSYSIAFWAAAIGLVAFSILIFVFARETLPDRDESIQTKENGLRSYKTIFSDKSFISFIFAFTLTQIGATIVWVLMGVYAKQNYHILENQYGLIPMTSALMVVLLQVGVTRISKRFRPLRMLTAGATLYALGVTSVAFAEGFWGF